ncbi:MAG: ATP-binding cassette domain-containing protein [Actinomycetota bacterium]|nr:ATP-binding cassette domain-containing protein [Actinomycetota bacterium]
MRGLDFEVARSSITGVLGPSGCGKTTLFRAIVGVQVVTRGDIVMLGEPAGRPSLRRRVGYATQSPAIYADLTVAEALRYFAAVLGAPRTDVTRVVDAVDLNRQADQFVGTLSGGQRSRASLAVALLGSPNSLFVLPQFLLCGLLRPRAEMGWVLEWLSMVMPLSYAVDALVHVTRSAEIDGTLVRNLLVVACCVAAALVLGRVGFSRTSSPNR